MFETFDHTADIGLRIRAPTLPELFAEAARGLFALIVAAPERIRLRRAATVRVPAEPLEDQLFDWLAEWLYIFDTEQLVCRDFAVRLEAGAVVGTGRGEPLDPDRHGRHHEVKAVTYHGLRVTEGPEGYTAEVILDI